MKFVAFQSCLVSECKLKLIFQGGHDGKPNEVVLLCPAVASRAAAPGEVPLRDLDGGRSALEALELLPSALLGHRGSSEFRLCPRAWLRLQIGPTIQYIRGMQQEGCKWILYLDSDAFWRSGQLQLQHMLEHLLSRYQLPRDCGTSGIFAREQPMQYLNITRSAVPPGAKPLAPFLNTGVFLLRADCPEALQLLDAWLLAAAEAPRKRLWNTWPAEQGILSELLVPGSYPPAATGTKVEGPKPGHTVAIVNMTEFNSPWGRFIHHAWGSEATDGLLRHQAMTDALLRIGAADPKVFVQLCRGVLRSSFWWQRWNWETLMETYAAAAK
eukprot:s162_g5.t1